MTDDLTAVVGDFGLATKIPDSRFYHIRFLFIVAIYFLNFFYWIFPSSFPEFSNFPSSFSLHFQLFSPFLLDFCLSINPHAVWLTGSYVCSMFALRVISRYSYRLPTVGSPYWMSPECLKGKWYDERSDVFSFGIVLCELIARIEADPDILPRTENFGLDYIAFSELCPDCPPEFLQLAFSCCHVRKRKENKHKNVKKKRWWMENVLFETLTMCFSFLWKKQMDPNSRPTFEELVVQLEQMIRQHSNSGKSVDVPSSDVTSDTDIQSGCLSSGSDVTSCCHSSAQAKEAQPSNKFDHDVYLVPGSSPSEKARCHYLQGRAVKEKPFKWVVFWIGWLSSDIDSVLHNHNSNLFCFISCCDIFRTAGNPTKRASQTNRLSRATLVFCWLQNMLAKPCLQAIRIIDPTVRLRILLPLWNDSRYVPIETDVKIEAEDY